jgi:hypothetical protein
MDILGPFLGNVPVLGSRFLIMQHLDYNSGRSAFYVVHAGGWGFISETRLGA